MFEQYIPSWTSNHDTNQSLDQFWTDYWDSSSTADLLVDIGRSDYKPIIDRGTTEAEVILEGGCGLGQWVVYLAAKRLNVHGLDISERSLRRLRKAYPGLSLQAGDIVHLPFPDNIIDVYISLGVIEHLQGHMEQAVEEAHRVLKSTGRFLVSVPYMNIFKRVISSPYPRLFVKGGAEVVQFQFFQYVLSKDEFMRLLQNCGFKVESVHFCGRSLGLEFRVPHLLEWEKSERQQRSKQAVSGMPLLSLMRSFYKTALRTIPHSLCANMIMAICRKKDT